MISNFRTTLPRALARTLTCGLLALAGFATHAQNLRIMPIGDSITSGFQSSDNNGYRGELYSELAGEVNSLDFVGSVTDGNMLDPDHEGHSGWRIDQVASILTDKLQAYRPNLVTLHIGTNDMGQNYDVGGAPGRLAGIIDQIFANDPGVTVVVASLVNPRDYGAEARTVAYNATIRPIVQARANAGKHIFMVDMSSISLDDLKDGLHPNDGGYRKMAGVWHDGIRQVIAAGWIQEPAPIYAPLVGAQSQKCLDIPGGSQANGTTIQTWGCNNGTNQRWKHNANGTLEIYGGMCLDVFGQNTAPGATVGIWGCNGGPNQQWQLRTDGSLVGVQSGLCLDVNGWSTDNGAKVTLWSCNGGGNQKWHFAD